MSLCFRLDFTVPLPPWPQWACGVVLFIMHAGFPPFEKASRGDWWFDALSAGRVDLFWTAHERTAVFPDVLKSPFADDVPLPPKYPLCCLR